jgi:hypothetical protein
VDQPEKQQKTSSSKVQINVVGGILNFILEE